MFSTNEDRQKAAVDASPKRSKVTSVCNANKRVAINPMETPEMTVAKMKRKDCDKKPNQIFQLSHDSNIQLSDECSSIGEAFSPDPPTPESPK